MSDAARHDLASLITDGMFRITVAAAFAELQRRGAVAGPVIEVALERSLANARIAIRGLLETRPKPTTIPATLAIVAELAAAAEAAAYEAVAATMDAVTTPPPPPTMTPAAPADDPETAALLDRLAKGPGPRGGV